MRHSEMKLKNISLIFTSLSLLLFPNAAFSKSEILAPNSVKNWGLMNSEGPSHIHALDAWKIEEGSRNVVVAVVDTGIDPNTTTLKANLWHSPKKGSTEYGWNFVSNQANPNDDHGHGTHVAGIIGAIADSRTGVSGVAHNVSIMPVKYYSDKASGAENLRNTIRAIYYAIDHGAKIINYSGGGPSFSDEEFQAIKKAESKGILFVAAAGNDHQDTDRPENYYYPAAYRLSNIISVGATDIQNNLLASSNWGKKYVDVVAPGGNIFSTLPHGKFGTMSGTSQATAFVSGIAALLLSKNPNLTPQMMKKIITASVDPLPHLKEKISTGGRVNAYRALTTLKQMVALGQIPSNEKSILAAHQETSPLSQTRALNSSSR